MSQPIGNAFKTRIPTFSDDASIQEAFSVYHYGKDDYSEGQSVPANSIEGHFVTFNTRVGALESTVDSLGNVYILKESLIANPNILTTEDGSVVPLTIRGKSGQTEPLQKWENSLSINVGAVYNDGGASFGNYVTVGNTTKSSNIALDVRIGNSSHVGVSVSGVVSQTGNLQEWKTTDGSTTSIIARVDSAGKIFSNNGLTGTNTSEVVTLTGTQTLTNKTLTTPTLTTPTIASFVNATHNHQNSTGGGTLTVAAISDIASNYAPLNLTLNPRTASYTLVLSDASKQIEMSVASANNLVVPANASVAFPIGTTILVVQTGTGQTTIVAASGVTINATPGLRLRTQWSTVTLVKRAANTWLAFGDLNA